MPRRAQLAPAVSGADVDRIVRRDYPPAAIPGAFAALARYGTQAWHVEVDRVRLAALKVAAGDLRCLRAQVQAACTDYRDVLAAAEYPVYACSVAPGEERTPHAQVAIEADWLHYDAWLRR